MTRARVERPSSGPPEAAAANMSSGPPEAAAANMSSGPPEAAAANMSSGPPAESAQTFEATLERLGTIVERLENGELGLEESLRLFEEGVGLARHAQARLDAAEKRVEELLDVDAQGKPKVRDLELDSG